MTLSVIHKLKMKSTQWHIWTDSSIEEFWKDIEKKKKKTTSLLFRIIFYSFSAKVSAFTYLFIDLFLFIYLSSENSRQKPKFKTVFFFCYFFSMETLEHT